jgi:energy-coupling factor transporter ATP-binding protein EcfA2
MRSLRGHGDVGSVGLGVVGSLGRPMGLGILGFPGGSGRRPIDRQGALVWGLDWAVEWSFMQLARLQIVGLFNEYEHSIEFSQSETSSTTRPSLVIIHGPNGVGKTTILRMIDGLLRLDFNIFRAVPFGSCTLTFSTGKQIKVQRESEPIPCLRVTFDNLVVLLNPTQTGPAKPAGVPVVEAFRQVFFAATDSLTFDFIDADRLLYRFAPEEQAYSYEDPLSMQIRLARHQLVTGLANPKARATPGVDLSGRVARFVRDAQVNYQRFFADTEADLFPRVIQQLTEGEAHPPQQTPIELLGRLRIIRDRDKQISRFGLEPDRWDFDKLESVLSDTHQLSGREYALMVLSTYVEVLEARVAQRALVAERLVKFEQLTNEFLFDKSVLVDPRLGIRVMTKHGSPLQINQLSSGEYHLLYLLVATLVTQRKARSLPSTSPRCRCTSAGKGALSALCLIWRLRPSRSLFLLHIRPTLPASFRRRWFALAGRIDESSDNTTAENFEIYLSGAQDGSR